MSYTHFRKHSIDFNRITVSGYPIAGRRMQMEMTLVTPVILTPITMVTQMIL